MGTILVGVMMVFATIAAASQLALHDHKSRKALVGTSGMFVIVLMYASPLSIIISIFHGVVTFCSGIYNITFESNAS